MHHNNLMCTGMGKITGHRLRELMLPVPEGAKKWESCNFMRTKMHKLYLVGNLELMALLPVLVG